MAAKKITIVLLPEGANRVKQFRFPRFLLTLSVLAFLGSASFFGWIIGDYQRIKTRIPRLAQLQKENELQKRQVSHLVQRIQGISSRMGELEQLDQKLKEMVNLDSEEKDAPFRGVGGSDTSPLPRFSAASIRQEAERSLDRPSGRPNHGLSPGQLEPSEFYKFLENQKILLASTPSLWPSKGWMSSRFGYRTSPFTGEKEFHRGIDVVARMGAPVRTPADGIVSSVDIDPGYGKVITVKHGYGVVTKYAHLEKCLVEAGQYVKRGEIIARVGSSGRSKGPHLHYEVHLNGVAVDPLRYIPN